MLRTRRRWLWGWPRRWEVARADGGSRAEGRGGSPLAPGRVEPPWALWRPGEGGPWPFGARERGRNPTCNPSNFEKENTCNLLNSEGLQVGLRPPFRGAKGQVALSFPQRGRSPQAPKGRERSPYVGARGPGPPLPRRQGARERSTFLGGKGPGEFQFPRRQRAVAPGATGPGAL